MNDAQKIACLEQELARCRDQLNACEGRAGDETLTAIPVINIFQNLSHELLTPMNSLLGLINLSMEQETPGKLARYLGQMKVSCLQLNSIIEELLMLVTLVKGKYHPKPEAFNLADMLTALVEEQTTAIRQKGLAYSQSIAETLTHDIVADAGAIRQVLQCLLDNAIKFTAVGDIRITAAKHSVDGRLQLKFCVEDTGIGIDAGWHQKVFQPFCQVDGSTTRKYPGIGLGLAISQQIIRVLGGKLTLDSQPGKGTRVCFFVAYQDYSGSIRCQSTEPEEGAGFVEKLAGSGYRKMLGLFQVALSTGEHARAESLLQTLKNNSESKLSKHDYDLLYQHLTNFDFEEALQVVKSLIAASDSVDSADGIDSLTGHQIQADD